MQTLLKEAAKHLGWLSDIHAQLVESQLSQRLDKKQFGQVWYEVDTLLRRHDAASDSEIAEVLGVGGQDPVGRLRARRRAAKKQRGRAPL